VGGREGVTVYCENHTQQHFITWYGRIQNCCYSNKENKSPVKYGIVEQEWRKEMFIEQYNSNERNGLE
jgi:uncharacterized protein YlbG (UPF0298 family)